VFDEGDPILPGANPRDVFDEGDPILPGANPRDLFDEGDPIERLTGDVLQLGCTFEVETGSFDPPPGSALRSDCDVLGADDRPAGDVL